MNLSMLRFRGKSSAAPPVRLGAVVLCGTLAFLPSLSASAQQPAPSGTAQPSAQAIPSATPVLAPESRASSSLKLPRQGGITQEELNELLVGKPLYLRGGYLDNTLRFNEQGALIGQSPQGSYTLNGVQIDKVRLSKHKVELVGARYGLHFLGALPDEDPTTAVDRVRITPKKKVLKITIDRELVATPKKKKDKTNGKGKTTSTGAAAQTQATAAPNADESPAVHSADSGSATKAPSAAQATQLLKEALDRIFAQGLDDRMMASMPDFWKLYYRSEADKSDYRPADPAVMRQNTVDRKARLVSAIEPESNEFAQANGVTGMALYHAVIGADGKPEEIAVGRPIGFGLDETAVAAIRKATFEPAIKDGKPVPVLLDLVVQFRIYSKRTAAAKPVQADKAADKQAAPSLPGPYSRQEQP
jgi:TonB family protein